MHRSNHNKNKMGSVATSSEQFCENKIFSYLHNLPAEIIEHILLDEILDFRDVINVAQVCSKFRQICQNNEVWKRKLQQRWASMLDRYERGCTYTWYDEYKNRHLFGTKVKSLVAELSPKHYTSEEISKDDFNDFAVLLTEHGHAGEFLIDELMSIVHDGQSAQNLTIKYYAEKVLRFLQQTLLSQKIKTFLELPPDKQSLETGAVLLSQWCQPTENIMYNEISDQLEGLAAEVKCTLQQTHPEHPILSTEIDEAVTSDLWTCDQCQALLVAINSVIFNKHKFCGNKNGYYQQANSYIDKVLCNRTGIPITLCIIYSVIARKLGIICEPVNFPSHFLLRWKQHSMCSPEQMYTYIDVFNGGRFLALSQLSQDLGVPISLINLDNIKITRPAQVFERMIRNLIAIGRQQGRMGDNLLCLRNALELSLLVSPEDFDLRLLLVRVNLHLNINLPDVIDCLQTIADEDQNRMGLVAYLMNAAQTQMEDNKRNKNSKKAPKVKKRENGQDAVYSVGMVMRHKRYNYNCVIYGWDNKCEASQEWIIQMGVNNLPKKDKQPFYNVLVEDGTNRYAAQENLTQHTTPSPIPHPEVGKYFSSYEVTFYIPNAEKSAEYPNDTEYTSSHADLPVD